MNSLRPYAGIRLAIAVTSSVALLVTLSGCSEHKAARHYALPHSMCGIPVDSNRLAPFMPSGRKLTVKYDTSDEWASFCEISIDSRHVVQTEQMWMTGGHDTSYFVGGQANSKLNHQAEDGRFIFSGWEGFGKTRHCRSKKLLNSELFTAFQMHSSDHQDADAMKQLITEFTTAVEKTDTCRKGKPFS
ncbi:hypothetical protein ACIHEJ_20460 [Streptomyces sp. NPDC052301]|uniref:hypothetical protein n=1 Tax=Streptomyces sp. NPDC052301 TaxID=3365687 RepID=UPI0037D6A464